MFKTLLKNKKAQNTAEYALLIALVVAGVIAMQTYAQRALQARVRDASLFMTAQTNQLGNTNQYEPYYTKSNYETQRSGDSSTFLNNESAGMTDDTTSTRMKDGFQSADYNSASTDGI